MAIPTTQNTDMRNATAAKYEKEDRLYLSRVVFLDDEMRETMGLTMEISKVLFEVIGEFLEYPADSRHSHLLIESARKRLWEVKEGNLRAYKEFVEARETFVQGGLAIPLNAQNRAAMVADFGTRVDNKIEEAISGLPLQRLEEFQKDLEKEISVQDAFSAYALARKTELTMKNHESAERRARPGQQLDLWTACEIGNLDAVAQIIRKSFFWNRRDLIEGVSKEGHSPLSLAVANNHEAIVDLLLKHDANPNFPNKEGYFPLHWAAVTGNCSVIGKLLGKQAFVNAKGEYQRTPLHMAIWHRNKDAAELLLLRGADVNAQTVDLITPLHTAVEKVDGEILLLLLKNHVINVNLADSKGFTPLYYAIALGLSDFASLIIGHKTWKEVADSKNPNHMEQLAKIKPASNADKIANFFKKWNPKA